MKKFKLPRKLKKKLRRNMWFYPLDVVTKTYKMGFPDTCEEDYISYKLGVLTKF